MLSHSRRIRPLLSALLPALVSLAASGPARAEANPARERQDSARAVHLLARATFGVRAQDLTELLAAEPAAWLDRQLYPERIADPALDERLARFGTLTTPPGELMATFEAAAREARRARASASPDSASMTPPARPRGSPSPRLLLAELVSAKLVRAVHSERQLEQVMTDFWYNHFNVFFGKGIDRYLVADYERSAIRPHVFGRFEDMLLATARHPAMLFYLDNWTSAAPDSLALDPRRALTPRMRERLARSGRLTPEQLERMEAAQARRRERGINENYARELLELHTLGVDGGYTQQDVVDVARAFTGWTFRRPGPRNDRGELAFVFDRRSHDGGEKHVLGVTLPAGRGIEDGEEVIRMLAAHPATARFLAGKLVERFVTDEPTPELVDEIADVYLRTDGDLREVTRALFLSEHFYDERWRGTKVKTPFELVASALRALGVDAQPSRRIIETLRAMGQLPYTESAPTGFPAMSEDWVNSSAMLARMNFGLALAAGRIDGIRLDPTRLPPADDDTLSTTLDMLLPGAPTGALEAAIRADLDAQEEPLTKRARAARALGLALGSPEFQRR